MAKYANSQTLSLVATSPPLGKASLHRRQMTAPAESLRWPQTIFRIFHRANIHLARDSGQHISPHHSGMIVVSNPRAIKANLDKSLCSNVPMIGPPFRPFEMVARGPHLIDAFR
jgi:hypothetical protein